MQNDFKLLEIPVGQLISYPMILELLCWQQPPVDDRQQPSKTISQMTQSKRKDGILHMQKFGQQGVYFSPGCSTCNCPVPIAREDVRDASNVPVRELTFTATEESSLTVAANPMDA